MTDRDPRKADYERNLADTTVRENATDTGLHGRAHIPRRDQRAPLDISPADIERRFTYHRPEGDKIHDHDDIRVEFKAFARTLAERLPAGREKSLAFTALEECANWSHAAIARDGK